MITYPSVQVIMMVSFLLRNTDIYIFFPVMTQNLITDSSSESSTNEETPTPPSKKAKLSLSLCKYKY